MQEKDQQTQQKNIVLFYKRNYLEEYEVEGWN